MVDPSRCRGWLLRALVLLLLPVVVLAQPSVAAAATAVSGQQKGTWAHDGIATWHSCSFQAFYSVSGDNDLYGQTVKVNSGNCETSAGEDLQGAGLTLTFNGDTPSGDACSASASGILAQDTETFGPFSTSMTGVLPVGVEDLCTVSEFCYTLTQHNGPFSDVYEGCEVLPMGVPELPSEDNLTGCPYFILSSATITLDDGEAVGGAYYLTLKVRGTWTAEGQLLGAPKVIAHPIWQDFDEPVPPYHYSTPGGGTSKTWNRSDSVTALPDATYTWTTTVPSTGWADVDQIDYYGMQMKISGTQFDGMMNMTTIPSPQDPNSDLGLNKPSECQFYIGDQIATTADETDVPGGPLDLECTPTTAQRFPASQCGTHVPEVPPSAQEPDEDPTPPATPVEDEGCADGFSIFNPLSWVSAGFCEVVSALSSLLKALRKIPGAVLGGLEGLFRKVFVPSDGYLEDAVGDVRHDFEETTPGAYVTALGDLTPGSVSGCGGLALDVPLPGVDTDTMHIGAACSGFMANVAALVRLGLSAVVVVGGGLACVRALGSGFGWRPGVGRGEAA